MAVVNVGDADFTAVASAAHDAKHAGDLKSAETLDKLARKINAALSNGASGGLRSYGAKPLTWRDVPSVFDAAREAGIG